MCVLACTGRRRALEPSLVDDLEGVVVFADDPTYRRECLPIRCGGDHLLAGQS